MMGRMFVLGVVVAAGCGPSQTQGPTEDQSHPRRVDGVPAMTQPGAGANESGSPRSDSAPANAELADCNTCSTEHSMGMPNWVCADGRRGGPVCKQLPDGGCGWVVVECERAESPRSGGVSGGVCRADANHCCQPDGTIVTPGGCQPSYPDDVVPATEREPDGRCKKIPCYKKCLPPTALIATPSGDVPIHRLRAGDQVWTVDASGRRAAAAIRQMSTVRTGAAHVLVKVTLADGRIVRASRGHPTATGSLLGELGPGARLDGSTIVDLEEIGYPDSFTWDLLPEGATGHYWADGVLLGSTLTQAPSATVGP